MDNEVRTCFKGRRLMELIVVVVFYWPTKQNQAVKQPLSYHGRVRVAPVCPEKVLEVEAWSKGFVLDYSLKALHHRHRHRWSWYRLVSKDGKFGTKACIAKTLKLILNRKFLDDSKTVVKRFHTTEGCR
jgi:hypothetical protein